MALNDQQIVKIIKKSLDVFEQATNDKDRLQAVLALSALAAVRLIDDRQLFESTTRHIEKHLPRV